MVRFFEGFKLLVVTLVLSSSLHAQWSQFNEPSGGSCSWVAANSIAILATVSGTSLRSTDRGVTWTELSDGVPGFYLTKGEIFHSVSGTSSYKSTDNGITFTRTTNAFPSGTSLVNLAVIGNNLFAVGSQNTQAIVFRSTDDGATWVPFTAGLPASARVDVISGDANLLLCGTTGSGTFGCYRSLDNGATWSLTTLSTSNGPVAALAATGTSYLASISTGTWRTTNLGVNWDRSSTVGNGDRYVVQGSTIYTYVGIGSKIFKSTNDGTTWAQVFSITPNVLNSPAITFQGTDLVVGSYNGMHKSTNGGTNWNDLRTGVIRYVVSTLGASGQRIFQVNSLGTFFSSNAGTSWTVQPAAPGILATLVRANDIIIGVSNEVQRSTDNGATWTPINSGLQTAGCRALIENAGSIWAAVGNGVYRTTNNGTNWTGTTTGIPAGSVIPAIAVFNNNIFAAVSNSGIYQSTNGGTSFTKQTSGTIDPVSFAQIDTMLFCGMGSIAGTPPLYRLNRSATTWAGISTVSITSGRNLLAVGNNLFVGNGSVFRSTDRGTTWSAFNDGFPGSGVLVASLALGSGELYAGAQSYGLWRRPLIQAYVREVGTELPAGFSLEQNYPNPFNPTTKIGFTVQGSGLVSLKVFDQLGREVATLVKENLSAGTYETRFDAAGLSSGTYYYRLQSGAAVQTRKLVLMK